MARPRILLLDEPSLGLSPLLIKEVRSVISDVRAKFSAAILLVEQNAGLALAVAERGYLLQHGDIVASGPLPNSGTIVSCTSSTSDKGPDWDGNREIADSK